MAGQKHIGLVLPVVVAGTAVCSVAEAEEAGDLGQPPVSVSFNIYGVSDYRARGLSYTNNEAALQGGADISEPSGWSAGIWASTYPDDVDADVEIDLYAAKSIEIGSAELALGAGAYIFPGADDWNFGEVQGSLSTAFGPVDVTLAANYAWEQRNLGDDDDFYVSASGATPVGSLLGAPLTLNASVGYEEGFFAIEDSKVDWSLGLVTEFSGVEVGISYVDTDVDADIAEGGWVFTLGRTF